MKPSIRWVGGKRRLLDQIIPRIPEHEVYFEPFVGGGAVLFAVNSPKAVISDCNEELINYYQQLVVDAKAIYDLVSTYENSKKKYYEIRELDRHENGLMALTKLERAARFLYLNKTSFQGMWRINYNTGYFNVPYCYPKHIKLDLALMQESAELFSRVEMYTQDFMVTTALMTNRDFVYFDPPYYHASEAKSMFQGYAKNSAVNEDHKRLRDECIRLDSLGAKFLLSNSDCEEVRKLWQQFKIEVVTIDQNLSAKAAARTKKTELLISNYCP